MNSVGIMDLHLTCLLVVGNSLSSAVHFEKLPFNFDVLPKNYARPKIEMTSIEREWDELLVA